MLKNFTYLLIALITIPFTASACGMGESVADGYENTAVKHAYQHWNQGARSAVPFEFIDVRTVEEFAAGHIEGAKLIPLEQFAERISEIPKDKQVYIYCQTARRSAVAASMLAREGFTNIENISGGIAEWQKAGYPVVK